MITLTTEEAEQTQTYIDRLKKEHYAMLKFIKRIAKGGMMPIDRITIAKKLIEDIEK